MSKALKEFRCTDGAAEYRVDEKTGKKTLSGYAAVFDDGTDATQYKYWNVSENIQSGAFARAIKDKQDVRGLFNHNPENLLGRISSGTLRLTEDKKGLRYDIDLPDTTTGKDVEQLVSRGDLSGSSFAFRVKAEKWQSLGKGDEQKFIRTITDVDLIDVGPVTFPAYSGTQSQMRSEDFDVLKAQAEAAIAEAEAASRSDESKRAESNNANEDTAELLLLRGRAAKAKMNL